jgi:hypothetical protein
MPPLYYNTGTGTDGVAQTTHGPYGSATRTAPYNPYTGTSARTASASTYYGTRSAGQAVQPVQRYVCGLEARVESLCSVGRFCHHQWESDGLHSAQD